MTAKRRKKAPSQDKLPPQSEADFKKQVIDTAQALGWLVHSDPDSRQVQGNPGFPDLVLVKDGMVIFAELKRNGAHLQKVQFKWMDALQQYTGKFTFGHSPRIDVWRPGDYENIKRLLGGE